MKSLENLFDRDGEFRTVTFHVDMPTFLEPLVARRLKDLEIAEKELGRKPFIFGRRNWVESKDELIKERGRLKLLNNYQENISRSSTRADALFAAIHVVGQEGDRLGQRYDDLLLRNMSQQMFDTRRLEIRAKQEDVASAMRQLLFLSDTLHIA